MSNQLIMNKTLTFVENNLSETLDLEVLSRYNHYSKFHFHRLFASEIGTSIIKYIRLRRVVRSTSMLQSTDISITEVALISGFTNIDTYIRSFKRYYGITPIEYRKLKQQLDDGKEKECTTMLNYFGTIKLCKEEEKVESIQFIEKMMSLSKHAHRYGLFSLEEQLGNEDSLYLKKAVELMVDGTDIQTLKKILINLIEASELTPVELFERVLYLEGVLLIHQGHYPWEIKEILSSYFGEIYMDKIAAHFDIQKNVKESVEKYLDSEVYLSNSLRLENEIKGIDKRSLQRLIRECDEIALAIASLGLNKEIRKDIIDCLSDRNVLIFMEIIDLIEKINLPSIVDSQNAIINVVRKLREENEIK